MEDCSHISTCICYACLYSDSCGCGECETDGIMSFEEGECDDWTVDCEKLL